MNGCERPLPAATERPADDAEQAFYLQAGQLNFPGFGIRPE
jgi:hypothetical protein